MYDSFGPPSVVLCCESKAKLAMVEQVQRGVIHDEVFMWRKTEQKR